MVIIAFVYVHQRCINALALFFAAINAAMPTCSAPRKVAPKRKGQKAPKGAKAVLSRHLGEEDCSAYEDCPSSDSTPSEKISDASADAGSHDWNKFTEKYTQISTGGGMKSLWIRRGASDMYTGMYHQGKGTAIYRHDGIGKPNEWTFQHYLPTDEDRYQELQGKLQSIWSAIHVLENEIITLGHQSKAMKGKAPTKQKRHERADRHGGHEGREGHHEGHGQEIDTQTRDQCLTCYGGAGAHCGRAT